VFVDSDSCDAVCTYDIPEAGVFDLASARFGSRPTAVLRAEFGNPGDGHDLAFRSANRILATALGSGHAMVQDAPGIVLAATRLVLAAARSNSPLPPCEQTPIPAAGGRCETG
jgi:hypothetical protein